MIGPKPEGPAPTFPVVQCVACHGEFRTTICPTCRGYGFQAASDALAGRIEDWLLSAIDQEYSAAGWAGKAARHIADGLLWNARDNALSSKAPPVVKESPDAAD